MQYDVEPMPPELTTEQRFFEGKRSVRASSCVDVPTTWFCQSLPANEKTGVAWLIDMDLRHQMCYAFWEQVLASYSLIAFNDGYCTNPLHSIPCECKSDAPEIGMNPSNCVIVSDFRPEGLV